MNIISNASRQIILDTETTGMNQGAGPVYQGHRIIEIGCVEVIDRRLTGRTYHQYINPEQPIDEEAITVHGITNERVANEPKFREIAPAFYEFINGAEIVAHNASFDVSFIDHEFSLADPSYGDVAGICSILDTLAIAKHLHPGQKNNLDALCKRYHIDNSRRDLHGALLDAEILADVYLMMTGGQTKLNLSSETKGQEEGSIMRFSGELNLPVIKASEKELAAHLEQLEKMSKSGNCLWNIKNN